MLLINWLSELYQSRVRVHSFSARRSVKSPQLLSPAIMVLESRILLSTNTVANAYVVTNTADSGTGSLRWAVGQANADHGADTITFDPTLFATPQTITLTTGQIDLNDAGGISITGPSAGVTISGHDAGRVFEVDMGSTANLTGLTITHGSFVNGHGGGVDSQGTATLTNCIVTGNAALVGGGVCAWQFGSITLTNSIVSNNSAVNAGGGVYALNQQNVVLTNCTVSGNSANVGGGIYDDGSSTVTMSGTTVSNNSVTGFGAAICGSGSLSITNSAINGNSAPHGSVGGIFVKGGSSTSTSLVSMTNVTVSNNSALNSGGLALVYGTETLTNVTISGNSASGQDGGIYSGHGNNLTLNNTIVAGNNDSTGARDISGATTVSGSNNLIGTGGSGGLVNGTSGNLVGVVNPLLAPLGNYGGSTWTIPLLPGSPAIDAGSTTFALATTDQRGKPYAGKVDIGAFESQGFTLSTAAGTTPQAAVTGYAFTNPLSVAVTANNVVEPVNGGVINVTVPLSGPSATLSSASATISGGHANVIATANTLIGSFNATASTTEAAAVTFNLNNVAPLPLGGLGGTSTYLQGGGPVQVAPALVVNPNLSLNIASAIVVFTNLQVGDRLDFNNPYALQHSLTFSPDGTTATLTFSGVNTASNYETTLRSIIVWNVAAIPGTSPRTATFTVTDLKANTVTGSQTISVTRVNQAPLLSGIQSPTLVYVANNSTDQPQAISSTISVFDADSNNLTSAKIQITSGYQNDSNSHDLLSFTPQFGIAGVFDPLTGTLTLTGSSSLSNYRVALRSVLFGSSGPSTNGTTRTISFTAYDDSAPTPLASNTITGNVIILLPPTLSGLNGTTTFNKGGSPVPIASTFGVNQPLGLNLSGATVTFTNLQPGDRFDFSNQFALQHSLVTSPDETSATLTLSGIATPAQYQATLQSMIYWNVAGKPNTTPRTATFLVTNAIGQTSATGFQNFTVAPAIKPPVLYGIEQTPLAYEANHPEFPPQPVTSTLIVTHPVSNNLTGATVQITSGYENNAGGNDVLSFVNQLGITGTFNPATGTMTLSGLSSLSNYRIALQSVTFSTSGANVAAGTRTLTFTAFDDTTPTPLASNQVTRNVAVTTTNASPVLSGTTNAYYLAIPGVTTPQQIVPDLQVTDSDSPVLSGTTISFTNWQDGDRLDFYNQFALQHTFKEDLVAHTASLTITGTTSVANYQTMLQSIGFYLVAANPSYTPRNLSITVNDGYSNSNIFAGTINVYTHLV